MSKFKKTAVMEFYGELKSATMGTSSIMMDAMKHVVLKIDSIAQSIFINDPFVLNLKNFHLKQSLSLRHVVLIQQYRE